MMAFFTRRESSAHGSSAFLRGVTRGSFSLSLIHIFYLDFSKNRVTDETMALLMQLARESGLEERRDAMFNGAHINVSEDRAVLHVALRMPADTSLMVDGVDVVAQVHGVLARMRDFCVNVRSGQWKGATGKPIKNVVNVGIGGSDLGPVDVYKRQP